MPAKTTACIALFVALFWVLAPQAFGDSGGARISKLPDSSELEGYVEVHHECAGGVFEPHEGCDWFAEVTQYPASVGCPYVYDGSHGVWVGPLEQRTTTTVGTFSFIPESSAVILCLYTSTEDALVGESHPFNTRSSSGSTVPVGKRSTQTVLTVSVFGGCHAHIYGSVAGIGSDSGSWSTGYLWGPRSTFHSGSNAQPWLFAVKGAPGRYKFAIHYAGGAHTLPSPSASIVFRLRACTFD